LSARAEALDDTLRSVLGKDIFELIHNYKKRRATAITKLDNNIDEVISYLEKLIGKEGTQIIQAISFKRLCLKLKQEYEEVEDYFSLLDKLYEMKFNMLAPSKDEEHTDNN
jgi:hypothetical protein